jgi:ribosomal protein S18 acetylase RimI-like enzyme
MAQENDMPVRTRLLQAGDRERWDTLWRGYLEFYRHDLPSQVTEFTWRRLIDPAQPLHGFVAIDADARVIGFVHYFFHPSSWSAGSYCYLEDLFVDPAGRSRGVGRALIEAVYRAADEHGADRVYWHTENTNVRAQGLYRQVAVQTPFLQFRRETAA